MCSILFFTYQLNTSISPQAGHAAMRATYISASLGLLAFITGTFFK